MTLVSGADERAVRVGAIQLIRSRNEHSMCVLPPASHDDRSPTSQDPMGSADAWVQDWWTHVTSVLPMAN